MRRSSHSREPGFLSQLGSRIPYHLKGKGRAPTPSTPSAAGLPRAGEHSPSSSASVDNAPDNLDRLAGFVWQPDDFPTYTLHQLQRIVIACAERSRELTELYEANYGDEASSVDEYDKQRESSIPSCREIEQELERLVDLSQSSSKWLLRKQQDALVGTSKRGAEAEGATDVIERLVVLASSSDDEVEQDDEEDDSEGDELPEALAAVSPPSPEDADFDYFDRDAVRAFYSNLQLLSLHEMRKVGHLWRAMVDSMVANGLDHKGAEAWLLILANVHRHRIAQLAREDDDESTDEASSLLASDDSDEHESAERNDDDDAESLEAESIDDEALYKWDERVSQHEAEAEHLGADELASAYTEMKMFIKAFQHSKNELLVNLDLLDRAKGIMEFVEMTLQSSEPSDEDENEDDDGDDDERQQEDEADQLSDDGSQAPEDDAVYAQDRERSGSGSDIEVEVEVPADSPRESSPRDPIEPATALIDYADSDEDMTGAEDEDPDAAVGTEDEADEEPLSAEALAVQAQIQAIASQLVDLDNRGQTRTVDIPAAGIIDDSVRQLEDIAVHPADMPLETQSGDIVVGTTAFDIETQQGATDVETNQSTQNVLDALDASALGPSSMEAAAALLLHATDAVENGALPSPRRDVVDPSMISSQPTLDSQPIEAVDLTADTPSPESQNFEDRFDALEREHSEELATEHGDQESSASHDAFDDKVEEIASPNLDRDDDVEVPGDAVDPYEARENTSAAQPQEIRIAAASSGAVQIPQEADRAVESRQCRPEEVSEAVEALEAEPVHVQAEVREREVSAGVLANCLRRELTFPSVSSRDQDMPSNTSSNRVEAAPPTPVSPPRIHDVEEPDFWDRTTPIRFGGLTETDDQDVEASSAAGEIQTAQKPIMTDAQVHEAINTAVLRAEELLQGVVQDLEDPASTDDPAMEIDIAHDVDLLEGEEVVRPDEVSRCRRVRSGIRRSIA